MDAKALKEHLSKQFNDRNWSYKWDTQKDIYELQIPDKQEPVEVSVPKLLQRIKEEQNKAERIVDETIHSIQLMFESVEARKTKKLSEQQEHIYPVMRSTSFPTEAPSGLKLVHDEHSAESRIYYALDLGQSYSLIDDSMLTASDWTKQELKERALFNLRRLSNEAKVDTVAGNDFYFISTTDGYAASRILNQTLLNEYQQKVKGDLCIAIPHQDVLIFADLRNEAGYDVLGQMGFQFYTSGQLPITALPFQYKDGQLEPIFILAKRKPKQ
ncbi:DUF1444 family protein [Bacillus horti]|uniref:Uncharacterized protein YtpQ (UPF0354 family) n=1 Tax=Caldalkalibacillus horti TaxID=77523 RepID=A0ABT9W0Y3_9BACI|nr:DUF1444 family protein [Bacillus horti]MDQ0166760.1 uncharacterized protein YtpQ (UPF0354 family) [Bacillus horti]